MVQAVRSRFSNVAAFQAWWEKTLASRALCPKPGAELAGTAYDHFLLQLREHWERCGVALLQALTPYDIVGARENLEDIIGWHIYHRMRLRLDASRPGFLKKIRETLDGHADTLKRKAKPAFTKAAKALVQGAEKCLDEYGAKLDAAEKSPLEPAPLFHLGSQVDDLATGAPQALGMVQAWRWPGANEHEAQALALIGDWVDKFQQGCFGEALATINREIGRHPWTAWRLIDCFFEAAKQQPPELHPPETLIERQEDWARAWGADWAMHLKAAFELWWKEQGWAGKALFIGQSSSWPGPFSYWNWQWEGAVHRVLARHQRGGGYCNENGRDQEALVVPVLWLRFAMERVLEGIANAEQVLQGDPLKHFLEALRAFAGTWLSARVQRSEAWAKFRATLPGDDPLEPDPTARDEIAPARTALEAAAARALPLAELTVFTKELADLMAHTLDPYGAIDREAEAFKVRWQARADGLREEGYEGSHKRADGARQEPVNCAIVEAKPDLKADLDTPVTLSQMSGITRKSKRTIDRWYRDKKLPDPDYPSTRRGKPHRWKWANVRPVLTQESGLTMPERFPGDQSRA